MIVFFTLWTGFMEISDSITLRTPKILYWDKLINISRTSSTLCPVAPSSTKQMTFASTRRPRRLAAILSRCRRLQAAIPSCYRGLLPSILGSYIILSHEILYYYTIYDLVHDFMSIIVFIILKFNLSHEILCDYISVSDSLIGLWSSKHTHLAN